MQKYHYLGVKNKLKIGKKSSITHKLHTPKTNVY